MSFYILIPGNNTREVSEAPGDQVGCLKLYAKQVITCSLWELAEILFSEQVEKIPAPPAFPHLRKDNNICYEIQQLALRR